VPLCGVDRDESTNVSVNCCTAYGGFAGAVVVDDARSGSLVVLAPELEPELEHAATPPANANSTHAVTIRLLRMVPPSVRAS
jgi:hypothetical protein